MNMCVDATGEDESTPADRRQLLPTPLDLLRTPRQ